MANLLRYLADLARDPAERARLRAAPDVAAVVLGDDAHGPLTGADVEVALRLRGASVGLDDEAVAGILAAADPPLGVAGAAARLVALCDALDAAHPALETAPRLTDEPVADVPVGEGPVGEGPVGEDPVGEDPVGEDPVGDEPPGEGPPGEGPPEGVASSAGPVGLRGVPGGLAADATDIDPEHPAARAHAERLQLVGDEPAAPQPTAPADGGWAPAVLDAVVVRTALDGVPAGARGTVTAVDGEGVEVEVVDEDGRRVFLGRVEPGDLGPG